MSILSLEKINLRLESFTLTVDLALREKVTGIFGPSGAGKTTWLEIIAGLRRPESGRLSLNGEVLSDAENRIWRFPEHRQIGYVPQDLSLFPHKTVRENLLFGASGSADSLQHVLDEFQLGALLARYPVHLSGGEQQRVAIGRALMSQPKLLMLDEPLRNLDRDLKERGLELFRRVRDHFNTPILYVTHDADEIVALCNEVILLDAGRVIGQGSPLQLFRRSSLPTYIPVREAAR